MRRLGRYCSVWTIDAEPPCLDQTLVAHALQLDHCAATGDLIGACPWPGQFGILRTQIMDIDDVDAGEAEPLQTIFHRPASTLGRVGILIGEVQLLSPESWREWVSARVENTTDFGRNQKRIARLIP